MNLIKMPKYAAMVVQGDAVTPEQAAEIIVRTDLALPEPSCTDAVWNREIHELVGIIDPFDADGDQWLKLWQERENWERKHGCLSLEYLDNRRIAHQRLSGWCDWNGNIGCDAVRVGKWATVEAILDEWSCIAEAFPFLRLTCHLWNVDPDEADPQTNEYPAHARAMVEFVIEEGEAREREPKRTLPRPRPLITNGSMIEEIMGTRSQRGCTIVQLRWGLEIAARSVAMKRASREEDR